MLPLRIIPPGTQPLLIVIILQILDLDPPTLPLNLAEYTIFMRPVGPIQRSQLRGAADAPSRGLCDVDVRRAIFFIFVDRERYGCVGDGFAEEPGDALLDNC